MSFYSLYVEIITKQLKATNKKHIVTELDNLMLLKRTCLPYIFAEWKHRWTYKQEIYQRGTKLVVMLHVQDLQQRFSTLFQMQKVINSYSAFSTGKKSPTKNDVMYPPRWIKRSVKENQAKLDCSCSCFCTHCYSWQGHLKGAQATMTLRKALADSLLRFIFRLVAEGAFKCTAADSPYNC